MITQSQRSGPKSSSLTFDRTKQVLVENEEPSSKTGKNVGGRKKKDTRSRIRSKKKSISKISGECKSKKNKTV
jgi:hypothetical protein